MAFKPSPLKSSFVAASIIGFLLSVFWLPGADERWNVKFDSQTWSFAFGIVFFLMFVAGVISMLKAPPESQVREYFAPKKESFESKKKRR